MVAVAKTLPEYASITAVPLFEAVNKPLLEIEPGPLTFFQHGDSDCEKFASHGALRLKKVSGHPSATTGSSAGSTARHRQQLAKLRLALERFH